MDIHLTTIMFIITIIRNHRNSSNTLRPWLIHRTTIITTKLSPMSHQPLRNHGLVLVHNWTTARPRMNSFTTPKAYRSIPHICLNATVNRIFNSVWFNRPARPRFSSMRRRTMISRPSILRISISPIPISSIRILFNTRPWTIAIKRSIFLSVATSRTINFSTVITMSTTKINSTMKRMTMIFSRWISFAQRAKDNRLAIEILPTVHLCSSEKMFHPVTMATPMDTIQWKWSTILNLPLDRPSLPNPCRNRWSVLSRWSNQRTQ